MPQAPGADEFRALARSSPWRFRTMHFTHRRSGEDPVEAWLTRPGELRVRLSDGTEQESLGVPYSVAISLAWEPLEPMSLDSAAASGVAPGPPPQWVPRPPQQEGAPAPRVRPDGLVAERPVDVDYDDPIWQDYTWVAMLDPVELSQDVAVGPVTADVLRGRPTWFAECRALDGYDPRCSCCALLPGEVTRRLEGEEGGRTMDEAERASWPTSYLVGLDVATGVVASLTPLDGDIPRLGFENVIHAAG